MLRAVQAVHGVVPEHFVLRLLQASQALDVRLPLPWRLSLVGGTGEVLTSEDWEATCSGLGLGFDMEMRVLRNEWLPTGSKVKCDCRECFCR